MTKPQNEEPQKNGDDKPQEKPDHEFEQETPHDPSQPEKAGRDL